VNQVQILADVAGTVWKVLVKEGDEVAADDTLLLIESMKMEIPVTAPTAGRIVSMLAAEGAAVAEDEVLAVLRTP
jgi:acetyl-CoA carboxylase biotin carboxyl carrier protein